MLSELFSVTAKLVIVELFSAHDLMEKEVHAVGLQTASLGVTPIAALDISMACSGSFSLLSLESQSAVWLCAEQLSEKTQKSLFSPTYSDNFSSNSFRFSV